jgi:serine/threonine-protein kinase
MSAADRNLLFGVLALQLDFVNRDALIGAMNAWVLEKNKPLGQVLAEQGALAEADRQALDALVDRHLTRHGGDPEKSLAAVSTPPDLRDHLARLADPDLDASLGHLGTRSAPPGVEGATVDHTPAADGQRYRVLRPLARGGLGEVFVAEDIDLGREVALKQVLPQRADDPASRGRFLREAQVNGRLEHPGIVPVYGLGHDAQGRPYYAMRLVQGQTLKEAIDRFHQADAAGRDPGERALALRGLLGRFVDVCQAVAYAHSRGVLHRDLKPANILLGKYGETLVVDWGLAKVVGRPEGAAEATLRPTVADAVATQAGAALGTPAYMSPEQALGRLDQVGPASDVYGLGATLYYLLTGQPPFRGQDQGELLRRVSRGEWRPPRQVKGDVPAALDAICRRAMALQPQERYGSAQALAADVERWLADEPVGAYREPLRDRAGRWARRHRVLVAATAVGVLVAALAGGAGLWWLARQAAERRQGVEAALADVARLQQQARWAEARVALDQAEGRLEGGGPESLRARLERSRRELELVAELDAIRLKEATWVEGRFDLASADRQYGEAFQAAGMAPVRGDAAAAAAWVRATGVREALVAALDDWAACAAEKGRRAWVLEVARRADPDPWRDRARDPAAWHDAAALARLAEEPQAAQRSPQLLDILGNRLVAVGGDGIGLLRRAQEQHPADFWVNFDLGNALAVGHQPAEAVGYLRAALAVRPATPAAYNNLGNVLHDQGKGAEAVAAYRRALALDPKLAPAHCGLGTVLRDQGQLAEAAAEFRQALTLDPKLAPAHCGLGLVLQDQGKLEEAVAAYRRAISLDPKGAKAHSNLGNALYAQGKGAEAVAAYRQAIALDPKLAPAHNNLGNVLSAQGKGAEAVAAYRRALALDPKLARYHYNLGLVLQDQGKLEEAVAAYRRALRLQEDYPEAHCNLGLLLQQQGNLREALAELKRGHELGFRRPGWPYPSKEWVRQCQRLLDLEAGLPAVLQGQALSASAAECLSRAQLGAQQKRYAEAARLYADAFAAQPTLADNLQAGCRYDAARVAAQAGCGQGDDAGKLDDQGRARWRRKARTWLRADLALWAQRLVAGGAAERRRVTDRLQHWQRDAALAGLRDAADLGRLPAAEQQVCRRLWADVASLLEKAGGQGATPK